jgi:hypothetical protein
LRPCGRNHHPLCVCGFLPSKVRPQPFRTPLICDFGIIESARDKNAPRLTYFFAGSRHICIIPGRKSAVSRIERMNGVEGLILSGMQLFQVDKQVNICRGRDLQYLRRCASFRCHTRRAPAVGPSRG